MFSHAMPCQAMLSHVISYHAISCHVKVICNRASAASVAVPRGKMDQHRAGAHMHACIRTCAHLAARWIGVEPSHACTHIRACMHARAQHMHIPSGKVDRHRAIACVSGIDACTVSEQQLDDAGITAVRCPMQRG